MAELTATVSEIMEVVGGLNDNGRLITLQQCLILAKHETYRNKETTTTLQNKICLDTENKGDREEFLRKYHKNRLEGDLQLEGYILLGWYQGRKRETSNHNWTKSKYGLVSERGMAAYLPKSGSRWVYIFDTHARYAAHPDPKWENQRWTHFAETDNKPGRKSIKKMLDLFALTKPDSYKERCPQNVWILSVPLWLLDDKKDMRPLYLAGGKPE